MVDIFISYSKFDRARTQALDHALSEQGYAVWWDKNLTQGLNFEKEIDKKLQESKVVIVIWSRASVESQAVLDEVHAAHQERKLLPVHFGELPSIPKDYRSVQSLDMSDWDGALDDARFLKLADRIADVKEMRLVDIVGDNGSALQALLLINSQGLLGLPLHRLLVGTLLVTAALALFLIAGHVLSGGHGAARNDAAPILSYFVGLLLIRGLFQLGISNRGPRRDPRPRASGRYYFSAPFAFRVALAALLAPAISALFVVPYDRVTPAALLETFPFTFLVVAGFLSLSYFAATLVQRGGRKASA